MNVLTWNYRGAAKKPFKSTFNRFYRKYKVGVAAIFIWICWDSNDLNITLLVKHDQFIHFLVELPGKKPFCWTTVYANPHEDKRCCLWEELKHIGRSMNDPWLILGDFNEIASAAEKRGGSPVDVNHCGVGNRFTWRGPKFLHLDRVYKRLDRAVANAIWKATFEDSDTITLPRLFSDHCPILVRLEKEDNCWRKHPFRFLATWQNDPRFCLFP
ncbi:uncharacterized protein LOC133295581 [Gastrolobium bilobum]|uniref:uncharacterized protein LOC133295581 n=1 Tax=Gastrolobium bilobum TaxID=150636 RepID=UPI002AB0FD78|nr:uncharacterized protein LOC133295581 [Gastrolobium bilobum]